MSGPEAPAWRRFLPQPSDHNGSFPSASAHTGQSVLVTGAGGYIGSALVKAIAGAGPRCIVLLDSSEQRLFEIQRDLSGAFTHVRHQAILGTVQDAALLDGVFSRYHPEIVYHAAAFKHVPLLELNPIEAVRNNTIGTYTVAQAARRHGTPKLVLISTDKAVNPHSVLGVSKRIAELALVALSGPECRMNAIRLCNVIGSGGSVVPIFLEQIAGRRPLTVTHPEASRWFLPLDETVAAVLACGAAACEGNILVPEPGEQVRIAELAAFLIRADGNGKIPILFTGLRPGDKLTEELVYRSEVRDGCVEGSLGVIKTCRLAVTQLESLVERLCNCIASQDVSGLIRALSSAVPEYVPSELVR